MAADFRGKKLPGGLSVGDFLLSDRMPAVWALIDKVNAPSQRLFERYDFEPLPEEEGNYLAYLRLEGTPVESA